LIPLVEVVGGRMTSEDAIKKALTFYGSIGKKPIHIRREVNGGSAEKEVARHEPMTHFHQYWRALFAARALTGA
jgi:3-hydroxyacyl-CoA dehydrogenase, NAD binding domain